MSRHQRQPPSIPRRRVLDRRVRTRLARAARVGLGADASPLFKTKADLASLNPSVYLGIEPDGTVFIVTHRSEMGTGIRTSLPMVAADELDADWAAAASSRASATPLRRSEHRRLTLGARLLRRVPSRRRVARAMLVSAAAAQWNVPAAQCVVGTTK
jgi:CO/xanthine dehydrogenase Mo-binding subunit